VIQMRDPCDDGGSPPLPPETLRDADTALAMLDRALDFLTACDGPGLPTATQAAALIALERAAARQTAARAKILSAFTAGQGYQADGQYGPRPWLRAFRAAGTGFP
jgi:hypothetical protein